MLGYFRLLRTCFPKTCTLHHDIFSIKYNQRADSFLTPKAIPSSEKTQFGDKHTYSIPHQKAGILGIQHFKSFFF